MTEDDVKAALIKAISEIQKNVGLDCPTLTGATKPLADVPKFDSPTGAAAASKLGNALGLDIPNTVNIFVDEESKANLTIDQTVTLVLNVARPKAKDAA